MEKEVEERRIDSSSENADLYQDFAQECEQKVDDLEVLILKLENHPEDREVPKEMYRILHTIKGTAACVGINEMANFTHKFEDYISPLREGDVALNSTSTDLMLQAEEILKKAIQTLRQGKRPQFDEKFWSSQTILKGNEISADKTETVGPQEKKATVDAKSRKISIEAGVVEELLERSGNLTIIRDLLLQNLETIAHRYPEDMAIKRSLNFLEDMEKENDLFQNHFSKLLKVAISSALRPLQRAIRDLSLQLGKKVKLEMHGTNVQIDYDLCQVLSDSLVHIVRNALDHGIEFPDERAANQKTPEARVSVRVNRISEELIVEIEDDGRGIDSEKIKKKALDKSLVSLEQLTLMPHEEVLGLIFESGFSTAEKVTEVSGRGVGLDMVMQAITGLKGKIRVSSKIGVGTCFTITIPEKKITNILSVLIADSQGSKLAIPRDLISEIKSPADLNKETRLLNMEDKTFLNYKNKYLPIVSPIGGQKPNQNGMVVVMEDQEHVSAVWVDEVHSIDKVIVKDFNLGIPSGSGYEKAAISGRFGLLLFLDLTTSTNLTKMRETL